MNKPCEPLESCAAINSISGKLCAEAEAAP